MSCPDLGLISVIIPAYNVEATLLKCVESVIRQTYQHTEIILVDDGSLDGTPDLCDEIASRYPSCMVIHRENGGLSAARNTGIDHASGQYLYFLDSDDYIGDIELSSLVHAANDNRADIVIGGFTKISESNVSEAYAIPDGSVSELNYWQRASHDKTYSRTEYIVSWGKLFKRQLFNSIRFDEGKIHEDEFIIHKLIADAQNVYFCSVSEYYYVSNDKSIMSNETPSSKLDGIEAYLCRSNYFLTRQWSDLAFDLLIQTKQLLLGVNDDIGDEDRTRFSSYLREWRSLYKRSVSFSCLFRIDGLSTTFYYLFPMTYRFLKELLETNGVE